MVIDFSKIKEEVIDGFNGGIGPFHKKCADDGKVKIMLDTLPAGSSIGLHTHNGNCEVMYVLKGTLTFEYDGKRETASAGEAHYCPCGHEHRAINETDEDAVFFAVVPQTK